MTKMYRKTVLLEIDKQDFFQKRELPNPEKQLRQPQPVGVQRDLKDPQHALHKALVRAAAKGLFNLKGQGAQELAGDLRVTDACGQPHLQHFARLQDT